MGTTKMNKERRALQRFPAAIFAEGDFKPRWRLVTAGGAGESVWTCFNGGHDVPNAYARFEEQGKQTSKIAGKVLKARRSLFTAFRLDEECDPIVFFR